MTEDNKVKKGLTFVEKAALAFIIILIIIILFLVFYQDVIGYVEKIKRWYENQTYASSNFLIFKAAFSYFFINSPFPS